MRTLCTAAALSGTILLAAASARAGQAPFAATAPDFPVSHHDRVYAAEQFSNTVSVIDPASNTLLGVIRLGEPSPTNFSPLYKGQVLVHGLGFSPDRHTLDEEFFDVLNDAGDGWGSAQSHELVSELQRLTTNRYPIVPCGNSARLFQYRGHVFFEGTWPAVDTWHEKHYVTRIENGRVVDVCGITFRDRIDVLEKLAAAAGHENANRCSRGRCCFVRQTSVWRPIRGKYGNVILKYNGMLIHSIVDIKSLVRRTDQGQTVMITLWHQNAEKTVEAHF